MAHPTVALPPCAGRVTVVLVLAVLAVLVWAFTAPAHIATDGGLLPGESIEDLA